MVAGRANTSHRCFSAVSLAMTAEPPKRPRRRPCGLAAALAAALVAALAALAVALLPVVVETFSLSVPVLRMSRRQGHAAWFSSFGRDLAAARWILLGAGTATRGSAGRAVWQRAVAEPPTRTRAPDLDSTAASAGEWTECLLEDLNVQDLGQGSAADSWSITEGRQGSAAAAAAAADALRAAARATGSQLPSPRFLESWIFRTVHYGEFERFLKIRGFDPAQVALHCRERAIDVDVKCSACLRLLRGGHYGSLGISVPAYPPQESVLGCLDLSKTLEMQADFSDLPENLGELGSEQRQTAFCNNINAQFPSMAP